MTAGTGPAHPLIVLRELCRSTGWLFRAAALTALLGVVPDSASAAGTRTRPASATPCASAMAWQVRLDQKGFSPGQIDGSLGTSTRRALSAFQDAHGLPATGKPDCVTWRALDSGDRPTLMPYTITASDEKGPFIQHIPSDMDAAAKLPALGYASVVEALAERFHAAPALLGRLNAHTRFSAGQRIQVPAVEPFDEAVKPGREGAGEVTVTVSRRESALRVTRADGTLMFYAPVSSGSTHDPLPPGNWKVTSVVWHPVFHYNPDLFWDADPNDTAATIQAGPNNPVGVVWIGLDIEHYGLHGTPEPSRVGASMSHGCVRLTNWDAARVAALVRPGTPVVFQ